MTSARQPSRQPQEVPMKSLLVALALAFAAPACVLHSHEPDLEVRRVAVSFEAGRKCHPSRYWNGERCVKKGRGHHRHHHHH